MPRVNVEVNDHELGKFSIEVICNLDANCMYPGSFFDGRLPSVFRSRKAFACWMKSKLMSDIELYIKAHNPFIKVSDDDRNKWRKNGSVNYIVNWPEQVLTLQDIMDLFPCGIIMSDQ